MTKQVMKCWSWSILLLLCKSNIYLLIQQTAICLEFMIFMSFWHFRPSFLAVYIINPISQYTKLFEAHHSILTLLTQSLSMFFITFYSLVYFRYTINTAQCHIKISSTETFLNTLLTSSCSFQINFVILLSLNFKL